MRVLTWGKKIRTLLVINLVIMSIVSSGAVFAENTSNNEKGKEKNEIKATYTKIEAVNENKENTEIIVKYKDESKYEEKKRNIKSNNKSKKLEVEQEFKKIEVLKVQEQDDVDKIISDLMKDPNIEYVQKNYKLYIDNSAELIPSERQWGLSNSGQIIGSQAGIEGIDLGVADSWSKTLGSSEVTIGVLDTGIDINHQALASSIYMNSNEIPGNGIDDDGNGYIDDFNGYDFFNNDSTTYDDSKLDYHGTHVGGIIAANDKQQGLMGVAPNVKILPLKFISGSFGYTSDAIEAIEYAKNMGVKIINASWGGPDYNPALYNEIKDSGILFIAASGNNGADVANQPIYPAGFDLPNIISVSSIDNRGNLSSFSNYGSTVDIAAPGENILSSTPENKYAMLSGTSMATPHVSGTAALILSTNLTLDPLEIKSRILNNGTKLSTLANKIPSQLMVSSANAINQSGITTFNFPTSTNQPLEDTTVERILEIENEIKIIPDYPQEIKDRLAIAEKQANQPVEVVPLPEPTKPKKITKTKPEGVSTLQATPSISVSSSTQTSFTINVTYPISGQYGNGLAILDKSTGVWRDIYGSFYAKTGSYLVNTLKPATNYDVQMYWYTDDTHSWTRQEKFAYTKTKSYVPTLSVSNVSPSSMTIDVVYPVSGINGNGLFILDKTTNIWTDISGTYSTASGRYGINYLNPNSSYLIQQVWYTDESNDWLRQEKTQAVVTSYAPEILYQKTGTNVFTNLEIFDTNVITLANHANWLANLDKVYASLKDLTGNTPFNGGKIEIRSTRIYPGGWAVSGNPILWYQPQIKKEMLSINNNNDWSFGIMHEISHDFDIDKWNFDAEFWANTKMYYSVEQNNSVVYMGGKKYTGAELKNYYKTDSAYSYTNRISANSYHNDMLTYCFIRLKDTIGWDPFKKTFRDLIAMPSGDAPTSKIDQFNLFMTKLKTYSNYDVLATFNAAEKQIIGSAFGGTVAYYVADDHGNTMDKATSIAIGSVRSGVINYPGDIDFFKFSPSVTSTYNIQSISSTDMVGELYDSNGLLIDSNDDSEGLDFGMLKVLYAGQNYYLKARHYSGLNTGDYSVLVSYTYDDYPNEYALAPTINVGSITNANIEVAGDIDYFKFSVASSGLYSIKTTGSMDSYGELSSDSGNIIAFGDDTDSSNVNFYIEQYLNAGATYYVMVSNIEPTEVGSYALYINSENDDHGNNFESATRLTTGSIINGSIEFQSDYDYFKFTPTRTGNFTITSSGDTDVVGMLYNANGQQIASNDDISIGNRNFVMTADLIQNNDYYILVKHYDALTGTGSYSITVN